ncbi:hypothetical protein SLS64_001560 [Diaporthe eres]
MLSNLGHTHKRAMIMENSTTSTPGPSSQPTDKTSQVGDQRRVVMSFAMQLERDMKKRREELYALTNELRAGRTELKNFEEEVAEYARLVEVDLQRPDAAENIRTSASKLKESQEIMEEAAKLVDQALTKIENRGGV